MKEFYVGCTIVAIKDHSDMIFKEGDTFIVKGLKNGCCDGSKLHIDIGLTPKYTQHCPRCDSEFTDKVYWFNSICFRPLDELTNISELTEILENTKPFEINK